MKELITAFLNIEDKNLLNNSYQLIKDFYIKSSHFDQSLFQNICESFEMYITQFDSKLQRKYNAEIIKGYISLDLI